MFTAKHNVKKHTVTIHAATCNCAASGSVWNVEAATAVEAIEVAREDAPNIESFKIAPCAE